MSYKNKHLGSQTDKSIIPLLFSEKKKENDASLVRKDG